MKTSLREVKEVTSGINIYLESIAPLLGVEATTEEDKKVGKRCWYKGEKKKSGRGGWVGRVEGRMNTLKLQVRDGSAAIRLKLPSGTLQLGVGFVSHL